MDIKAHFIKRLTDTDESINYMVSHHILSYFPTIIVSIVGIIILFFLYKVIDIFSSSLASYIIGILGIILYFYFLLRFLDIYLDALIITDTSFIIHKWDGLFKSNSDVLFLEAVESVYADQSGIIDTLFNKGDIVIRRAGHENKFNSVYNPTGVANKINSIINFYDKSEHEEEEKEKSDDFKLFVQAMAEVIKEYGLNKK